MPTLRLYPFRFYDLVTRRWHRGRYVGTIEQLTLSHAAIQITGPPEVREVPERPALGLLPPSAPPE